MSIVSSGITLNTAYNVTGDLTGNLIFQSNGTTEAVRIDTNQNVGIGTANPGQKLEVNGWVRTGIGASATGGLELPYYSGSASSRTWRLRTDVSAYGDFSIAQATTQGGATFSDKIYIDASGNVGIGTTSPAAKLELGSGTLLLPNNVFIQQKDSSGNAKNVAGVNTSNQYNFGGLDGSSTVNTIRALVAGNEAMRIDSSGNVGIGTTSPANRLDVSVTGADVAVRAVTTTANYATFRLKNSVQDYSMQIRTDQSNAWTLRDETAGANRLYVDTNGRVQINTTNSGRFSVASIAGDSQCAYFYSSTGVNNDVISCQNTATSGDNRFMVFYTEVSPTARGNITYNRASNVTAYNTTSDQRLKENIVSAPSAFNKINSIKIRSFDWKENKSHSDFGVIAQELYLVAPEAVTKGVDKDDGSVDTHWAVDTSTLVPMLIKAIQELKAIVDAQAIEIAELKGKA